MGLLPLYETPSPDGPVVRLVGGTDVADYLDLIAVAGREEEVWKALLPVLAELPWRVADLRPLPAESPTPGAPDEPRRVRRAHEPDGRSRSGAR